MGRPEVQHLPASCWHDDATQSLEDSWHSGRGHHQPGSLAASLFSAAGHGYSSILGSEHTHGGPCSSHASGFYAYGGDHHSSSMHGPFNSSSWHPGGNLHQRFELGHVASEASFSPDSPISRSKQIIAKSRMGNDKQHGSEHGTGLFAAEYNSIQASSALGSSNVSSSSRHSSDTWSSQPSNSPSSSASSCRVAPQATAQHRHSIDPRLVVGSPLEIAWEVLKHNPCVTTILKLQRSEARLQNVPVLEDDPLLPAAAEAATKEQEGPITAEQLTRENGLVRSCRGLPARVRDDLIRAARVAVTRHDAAGNEAPGTGLLPFFWRVQANLKWLLRQPATLKGQLQPGEIDCITEEQRGLSFQKTVEQRMKLGELAVVLHQMLLLPDDEQHQQPERQFIAQ